MKYKKHLLLMPFPPPFAGPEIIAKEILESEAFLEKKNIVHINSNIRNSNSEKGNLDLKGILSFIWIYIKFYIKLLTSENVFIYLSSSKVGFFKDSIYIVTCWLFRKKCIAQYHGANFLNFYLKQNKKYQNWIRFSLNKLNRLLVLGESIKKDFSTIYNKEILVLPNGIKIQNDTKNKQIEYNSTFNILFLGHLIYSKGFHLLVDAYKNLFKKYGKKVAFLYAGENIGFKKGTAEFLNGEWQNKFLEEGSQINIEVQDFICDSNRYNASYLGFVSDKEKEKVFKKADILVLPSFTEGFSMSVLEGMAYGLPVIVTPVGAMPEIVTNGKNGLITPVGDVSELVKNIEYFIKNPKEIERIGNNNLEYVRECFDIEVIAKQLISILESV